MGLSKSWWVCHKLSYPPSEGIDFLRIYWTPPGLANFSVNLL